jgi:RNA polymerase sigma-70 factor (ECF subfamily)
MAESSVASSSQSTDRNSDEIRFIRAARQNPKAFGELYKRYVEQVFKYLYSRVGNVPDAEDITAQTFLAAFESFERFREEKHFAAWLFSIARNKVMDYFRAQNTTPSLDTIRDVSVENDPLSAMVRSEQVNALSGLIRSMKEEEQELLRLRFLAEMSFPEIAYCLHRKEDAVKKSIYRLLARLRNQLEVSNE